MEEKIKKVQKHCTKIAKIFWVLFALACVAAILTTVFFVRGALLPGDAFFSYPIDEQWWLNQKDLHITPQTGEIPEVIGESIPFKEIYLIQMGTAILGLVLFAAVFWLAACLFDRAAEQPFSRKNTSAVFYIGLLFLVAQTVPDILGTILYGAFTGGVWRFFPGGLPIFELLVFGVMAAMSKIFDYGWLLQEEYDQTV